MDASAAATKAARGFGTEVENAVKMELRRQNERPATKAIDFATAVALASLIVQCVQFALELRRQGKQASKEQLGQKIDELQRGSKPLPDATKHKIVDRVADAISGQP